MGPLESDTEWFLTQLAHICLLGGGTVPVVPALCLVPTQPHRRHPAQLRAQKLFAFLLCTTSTSSTIKDMVWKTDSSIPFLWTYAIDQDDKHNITKYKFQSFDSFINDQKQMDLLTNLPTFQSFSKVRFRFTTYNNF